MVGVAYTVGSLSNAWFTRFGELLTGQVVKVVQAERGHALIQLVQRREGSDEWLDVIKETPPGGKATNRLESIRRDAGGAWVSVPRETNAVGVVREGAMAPVVLDQPPAGWERGGPLIVRGRSLAITYARGISDQIMPTYITTALPKWFGLLFLLVLLAAAMSTLSSQFHTLGTAAGRDVYQQLFSRRAGPDRTVLVVRVAILIGLALAVTLGHSARGEYIIARATAIFFGLCAAAFLPAYVGGLFWPGMTRTGALASMMVGFVSSLIWVVLVKRPECTAIGLVKVSVLESVPNWSVVDPILIALPLSALTAVIVSRFTAPCDRQHLARCFPGRARGSAGEKRAGES
jgi:SSS family solute:Na+ symporter